MHKNDFELDYHKPENVVLKLKEIHEERNRGKFDIKSHISLLTHMLGYATELKH